MFKGLSGLKKAVKGGISAVSETTTNLAEQVVGDPATSKSHLKESLKQRVQEGVATVVGASENVIDGAEDKGVSKEKVTKVAHDIKHYGQFGEEYLGYDDPTRDIRKLVKQKEKAAKKARKAKKKKTGKKEDLFDPENLAKYKKELEEKRKRQEEEAAAAAGGADSDDDDDKAEDNLDLNLASLGAVAAAASSADSSTAHTPHREGASAAKEEKNDDWKLFQSLTSGVDSLIKQKKDELVELKEESFFRPKQAKVVDKTKDAQKERKLKKKKKWVDLDSASFEDFDGDVGGLQEKKKEDSAGEEDESETEGEDEVEQEAAGDQEVPQVAEAEEELQQEEQEDKPIVFKEPSDDEVESDDDLFNTNFVDAVTSGDVKLAVIPDDDPIFNVDEGDDDPFNTRIADVVVKKQEEEKRREQTKLKFTGLSSVADVLAGKAEKVDRSAVEVTVKRKRRRANRINLIGEDGTEVTNLEDISKAVVDAAKPVDQVDILTKDAEDAALDVPEGDLLASTPSPCAATAAQAAKEKSKEAGLLDLSEFDPEYVAPSAEGSDLTSNVAILAGEFSKPVEEEEDEFDAAFDALAQESVTKTKLEELEKQFEDELDDIFDTSKADKVLQLASLLDKVEEPKNGHDDDEEGGGAKEEDFDDPFDTTAYEHITGEVEEELGFESLAKREGVDEANEGDEEGKVKPVDDAGSNAFFNAPTVKVNDEEQDWAAFAEDGTAIKKKPSRPPPPKPAPKRPPPPARSGNTLSEEDAPPVIVKAPSTDSIQSWNCAVADNLIKKSKLEAADEALLEQDEFDPFDTTEFGDSGVTNFEDPFDTTAIGAILGEDQEDEEKEEEVPDVVKQEDQGAESDYSNEEEEVPDPFDILTSSVDQGDELKSVPVIAPRKKEKKEEDEEDADPFDTSIATKVLPNKGDPFDTSYVKGDPGKAELRALEEELLALDDKPAGDATAGRARPKAGQIDLSQLKAQQEEEEEDEVDPFDTTLADKVIRGESLEPEPEPEKEDEKPEEEEEEEEPPPAKVEDDEFDPTKSFARSISVKQQQQQEAAAAAAAERSKEAEAAQIPAEPTLALGQLRKPPSKRDVVVAKKDDSIDSDDFDPRA